MFLEGCRFLVLADAGTGLVGVAAVDGHTDRTQSDCLAFFKQLAVTEASPVVVEVLTDSDAMLGEPIATSWPPTSSQNGRTSSPRNCGTRREEREKVQGNGELFEE